MNKIVGFFGVIVGVIGTVLVLFYAGEALAGPKECPPGQRESCNTFKQKETGKLACFPANANPKGWVFLHTGCDDNGNDPPPTADPFTVDTATPARNRATVTPTVGVIPTSKGAGGGDPAFTPTPTPLGVWNEDCGCLILTQLVIMNDLERTELARK